MATEFADFNRIELEAVFWTSRGFEPVDAEPGEWLVLERSDGWRVEIDHTGASKLTGGRA